MNKPQDTLTKVATSPIPEEIQDRLMRLDFFTTMTGRGSLTKLGFDQAALDDIARTTRFRPLVQDSMEKVATQVYGPEFKVSLSAELIGRLKTAQEAQQDDTRTFPISRFFTSPLTTGLAAGLPATALGLTMAAAGKRDALPMIAGGVLGGGGAALTTALYRALNARAARGRARLGEGQLWPSERALVEPGYKSAASPDQEKTAAIKRACSSCGPCDPDKSWAASFAGTPLHERALAADMEREQLNLARDEKYLQEEIERGQVEHEEGVLRVDKKRLELALAKMMPGVKRDYDRSWSDMFVGTPLHNTALQLDVKDKELDLKRETNYVARDSRNNAYNQRRNANDVERSRLELELAQHKLQQAQTAGDVTKIAACQKTMAVAVVKHKGAVRKKVAAALLPMKAKIPIMVSMGALGAATSFAATKARAEDGSSRMEQYFKNMQTKHPSGILNNMAESGQGVAKQLKKMPAAAALIGAGAGTALGVPAVAALTKSAQLEKDAGAVTEWLKKLVGSQAGRNAIGATEKKMVNPKFVAPSGAANMVRRAEQGGVAKEFAGRRTLLPGV